MGLRDLFAAHALESARPAPPVSQAPQRQTRARRRHGSGRIHARAPPDERRPHGRRHRRAQDRAARRRSYPASNALGRARAVRADPRRRTSSTNRSTTASWRASAASPNTASRCAGTRTSSSSSGCCSSAAAQFALFGGVRFGGTLTVDDAFDARLRSRRAGAGAGRPTVLDMPNGSARGVRTASDFLMALQLTGAAKRDSIANMQIRLPVVVIGGGLDRDRHRDRIARVLPGAGRKIPRSRYEALVAERGAAAVRVIWNRYGQAGYRRVSGR